MSATPRCVAELRGAEVFNLSSPERKVSAIGLKTPC